MSYLRILNSIESVVVAKLRRFPYLKKIAKYLYVTILSMFRPTQKLQSMVPIKAVCHQGYTFFGYYDKTPVSHSGRYIAYHRLNDESDFIQYKPVVLVVKDRQSDQVVYTTTTNAYNLQQGARLQWISESSIAFNQYDQSTQTIATHIVDIVTGDKRVIPIALADMHPAGQKILSLDYFKLDQLNVDYGYRNLRVSYDANQVCQPIQLYDMSNNQIDVLVELEVLLEQFPIVEQVKLKDHVFNHICFSPKGDRFVFLHRYYIGHKRVDRLFHYHFNKGLTLIATGDIVSHFCWCADNRLMAYLTPLGAQLPGFYWVDLDTHQCTAIAALEGLTDGHPSFNGEFFVLDSYPDRFQMQSLYLYHPKSQQLQLLSKLYHSLHSQDELRCDLHPRIVGTDVYVDSIFNGVRSLYQLDVSHLMQ